MRSRIHVVLVHPERPVNVGAAARALANMALSDLRVVGDASILGGEAWATAKHARPILEKARFYDDLVSALEPGTWSLALTAKSGTPWRPHPVPVRDAAVDAVARLVQDRVPSITLVFGREGDGLLNDEIARCSEVVTIPSPSEYATLNLAQAVMVTVWEVNMALLEHEKTASLEATAWARMVDGWVDLAGEVGFYLPHDPRKMRSRLNAIFSALPRDPSAVRTLFGLLGQIRRHLRQDGVKVVRAFARGPGG